MKKISLLIITLIYVNSFSQKINTFETTEEKIDYYKDIFDLASWPSTSAVGSASAKPRSCASFNAAS